ncbi:MAG: hypothetical protein ETSY1_45025 [Candidatus Entotheonella factor]|uniref:DUF4240 domain-containing protein n=1 Tax=Entotheonella factor TaxID=1429438 RepID=W4L2I1_ENTF1|nr:MAG: hypothetical protein ETSY1_45025 [Candidatus Entotheonella factor]
MDEQQFWAIIDEAWKSDINLLAFRNDVWSTIDLPSSKESFDEKYSNNDSYIPNEEMLIEFIQGRLDSLSAEELHQFDMILERKLFDIDRQDVHEHTDGSDDGFLYCRGFIVAIGQEYYDAVNRDPSNAMFDWECEELTHISWHLYEEKFGEMPTSGISRETCSNKEGWPE